MPEHLTPEDLAERWRRPIAWVRRSAAAGLIPGFKVGGLWRFDLADVEAYESRRKNPDPLSMTDLSAQRQRRAS